MEEGPMQSLPDELLLEIFGRVKEAETLLDSVAFVCKRWNALAREAQAWASAKLVVKQEEVTDQKKRVLLRAPALRALRLQHLSPLLSTLRRSRLEVTGRLSIALYGPEDWDEVGSAVLALLERSRRRLREVEIYNLYTGTRFCLCADRGEGRSLFDVLAAMPELRRLDLTDLMLDDTPGPIGLPACDPGSVRPPPQLRQLSVLLYEDTPWSACLVALIRAAAPSLRSLSLSLFCFLDLPNLPPPPPGLSADLDAAVGLCVGLRQVVFEDRVPPLSALAAWTSLECLEVSWVSFDSENSLSHLEDVLRFCVLIGSLRQLVGTQWTFRNGDELERCRQLVGALRQARPEVLVEVTATHEQRDDWNNFEKL